MFNFEWSKEKEKSNIIKHGVSFRLAIQVFDDGDRIIERDKSHSVDEDRFFCYGLVDSDIMTVRFTMRGNDIRIFGAAYWRKGRKIYEKKQKNIR